MTQPTILGAGTNSKAYQADNNGTGAGAERVFSNVAIPANANTVILLCGIDEEEDSLTINSLTWSGLSGEVEIIDISISATGNDYRSTRLGIYDVTGCGAGDATITAALTGADTDAAILGVVCTDGFIESFQSSPDRLTDPAEVKTFSGNMQNNIFVFAGIKDKSLSDFAFTGTGVSDIFKTDVTGNGCSAVAALQATTSASGVKEINYASTGNIDDMSSVSLLISSQPNAFADIDPRGDIISHDIITN